jgi:hypothetical protein
MASRAHYNLSSPVLLLVSEIINWSEVSWWVIAFQRNDRLLVTRNANRGDNDAPAIRLAMQTAP